MGVVYRAEDPRINRIVAVKLLSPERLNDNVALERFKREARSAGMLRHPHIAAVYDVNFDGEVAYIVMEHVAGEALDRLLLRQFKLSPLQAVHYLQHVASALDYAHEHGVLHRDIKPSNIIIDPADNAFLVDFSIALIANQQTERRDTVVGTPSYMSPEQLRNAELDARSDLFSFAVVLYECLTGRRPFGGQSFGALVQAIVECPPLAIKRVAPELPAALDDLFARALAKHRAERFTTARELLHECGKLLRLPRELNAAAGGSATSVKIESVRERASANGNQTPLSSRRTQGRESPRGPLIGLINAPQLTAQEKSLFFAPDEVGFSAATLPRPATEYRRYTRYFIAACAGLSILLAAVIAHENSGSHAGVADAALIDSSFTMAPIIGVNAFTPEELMLKPGELAAVPRGKIVPQMNEREIHGALSDTQVDLALLSAALEEAHARSLPELWRILPRLFSHDSHVIRVNALRIAGDTGDRRLVSFILPRLDDLDPLVRAAAARAIANLADRKALGYLEARRNAERVPAVRNEIAAAIATLTGLPAR